MLKQIVSLDKTIAVDESLALHLKHDSSIIAKMFERSTLYVV